MGCIPGIVGMDGIQQGGGFGGQEEGKFARERL
jgi:hypothetical protein